MLLRVCIVVLRELHVVVAERVVVALLIRAVPVGVAQEDALAVRAGNSHSGSTVDGVCGPCAVVDELLHLRRHRHTADVMPFAVGSVIIAARATNDAVHIVCHLLP